MLRCYKLLVIVFCSAVTSTEITEVILQSDSLYLIKIRRQQDLDDGHGLVLVPANHSAEGRQSAEQNLWTSAAELCRAQTHTRLTQSLNAVQRQDICVTGQSSRHLRIRTKSTTLRTCTHTANLNIIY